MNLLKSGLGFYLFLCVSTIIPGYKSTMEALAQSSFEIVVYGGTSAGFSAALEAAKSGKKTLLISHSTHIGGMLVEGLGGSDIDNHQGFQNSPAVSGIALEFYRRIAIHYGREKEWKEAVENGYKLPELWKFESSVAEGVISDWLDEYENIEIIRGSRLVEGRGAVLKEGPRIKNIILESGERIEGEVFVDASYEGDLLAAAGISFTVGRESNSTYGETLNGIRKENTYRQFEVKVNPYRNPNDPESGLIHTIQDEPLGTPGEGDDRIQAYCFRMCLTREKNNLIPFTKPDNYEREHYEIYLRYLRAGGKLYVPNEKLPNGKTDLGAWHDLSHNLYGMNRGYPTASYAERARIIQYHRDFTQGLFYFLSNDLEVRELDEGLQETWSNWGLAKDEFTDNNGWPRDLYVRGGRRMVSDYVITEHHVKKMEFTEVEDPIALAYWPPDVHHVRRIVKDGYAYNEGFVFGGENWRPLPISFRSLIPPSSQCTNLITPTCLSSSHIAYGAIRLEWTFMILGQVASIIANEALERGIAVQRLAYPNLLPRIEEEGIVTSLGQ
ncbi:FAD-dependent oxidoreductase [Pleomorphovibrio marinus]|uniref:FAD-dependent oxidoreductase n=1 Tax=Pleomorphovibrio marinus TaxID=2164132 RepID=UPI000E0C7431|nr:FAD-dependent oxidoreductase [Pleomorphovibrio marinus]